MSVRNLFIAFVLCGFLLGVNAYTKGMLTQTFWSGVCVGASTIMAIVTSKRRE